MPQASSGSASEPGCSGLQPSQQQQVLNQQSSTAAAAATVPAFHGALLATLPGGSHGQPYISETAAAAVTAGVHLHQVRELQRLYKVTAADATKAAANVWLYSSAMVSARLLAQYSTGRCEQLDWVGEGEEGDEQSAGAVTAASVLPLAVELQLLAATVHHQHANNLQVDSCCNSHRGDQIAQQQQQQGAAADAAVPQQQYITVVQLLSRQCLFVSNRLLLQHVYEAALQRTALNACSSCWQGLMHCWCKH
jgi:hypothetical protein